MKNKNLNSTVLAAFLAGNVLTSVPLYSMQSAVIDEDSSDETESMSSEETGQEQAGSGMRAFFAAQIAGARELLSYGRSAAADLFERIPVEVEGVARSSDEKSVHSSLLEKSLVEKFLSNPDAYAGLCKGLPRDISKLLARYFLRKHPLVKVICDRLGRHARVRTLIGHYKKRVMSAQFNGSGNRIVTGSMDGTAKIWDVDSGECLRTLGHGGFVYAAHFNGAGNRIVTGSSDSTAKIWDADSGVCLLTLEHGHHVHAAHFNGAGNRIVTGSSDSTAKIWDADSGVCLLTLEHGHHVHVAHFNGAGNRIVTSSGIITKIWDVDSGECLRTFAGHTGSVRSARFNRGGNRIVTASWDSRVKIWDVDSGECLLMLGHSGWVNSAQFNEAGNRIVTASNDRTVKIWDVNSGECLRTLTGHQNYVESAQFNGTGNRMVTASWDSTAKIWDVERLFWLSSWFDTECTLEQALLFHCIYETRITHALLKKRNPEASIRFDFNTCPHLQEHFDTMPIEIQACLEPFVIRKV